MGVSTVDQFFDSERDTRIDGRVVPNVPWIEQHWIPALRSGGYEQTTGFLHLGERYCCLGVACNLVQGRWVAEGPVDDKEPEATKVYSFLPDFGDKSISDAELPNAVRNLMGFSTGTSIDAPPGIAPETLIPKGSFISVAHTQEDGSFWLSAMNDNGVPFVKIAELLEVVCQAWRTYAKEVHGCVA